MADYVERFWARVHCGEPDQCWEWQGGVSARGGHGKCKDINGLETVAHRVSWWLARGPVPDGRVLLHTCDNPRCVNVEHLKLGSQADNMRQMHAKGRAWGGQRGQTNRRSSAPARLGVPRVN